MPPNETTLRIIAFLRTRKCFTSWWDAIRPTDQAYIHAAIADYVQESCDWAAERNTRRLNDRD